MRRYYAFKAFGVVACLMGVVLMWNGSILGERTTGIATVLGITGIGMISLYQRSR